MMFRYRDNIGTLIALPIQPVQNDTLDIRSVIELVVLRIRIVNK